MCLLISKPKNKNNDEKTIHQVTKETGIGRRNVQLGSSHLTKYGQLSIADTNSLILTKNKCK